MSYSGGDIGIGTATPGALLQVTDRIRMGSETGTNHAPDTRWNGSFWTEYSGLVIRRTISSDVTAGNVIARSDQGSHSVTLERDGTDGGLQVSWTAGIAGGNVIVVTLTKDDSTTSTVHKRVTNAESGAGGTFQLFADADDVVHARITFGNAFQGSGHTEVTLFRFGNDHVWIGSILSTSDQ